MKPLLSKTTQVSKHFGLLGFDLEEKKYFIVDGVTGYEKIQNNNVYDVLMLTGNQIL